MEFEYSTAQHCYPCGSEVNKLENSIEFLFYPSPTNANEFWKLDWICNGWTGTGQDRKDGRTFRSFTIESNNVIIVSWIFFFSFWFFLVAVSCRNAAIVCCSSFHSLQFDWYHDALCNDWSCNDSKSQTFDELISFSLPFEVNASSIDGNGHRAYK